MSTSKNWEDYASPCLKDLVKKIEDGEDLHSYDIEYVKELKELALNPDHCHVLATPLLELSSVSVCSDKLKPFLKEFGSCFRDEIHVSVKVIDNDFHEFLLFDSDISYGAAVLVFLDDKLNIRLENSKLNRPLWVPKYLSLQLLLEDKSKGIEIVDNFRLSFDTKVVYDKQHCLELRSREFGLVLVHCAYFRYATLVTVDCRLEKIDDIGGSIQDLYAHVNGAICAKFRVRDRLITRALLNQRDGDPAQLCWSLWLAVPAYSALEIIVDSLVINHDKIDTNGHNLKFEPHHQYSETIEMVGQKWRFLVTVEWNHVYKNLPPLCECDCDDVGGSQEESTYLSEFDESDCEISEQSSSHTRQEKRPRLQCIELPASYRDMLMRRMDPLPSLRLHPLHLVEVFSISVCPYAYNLENSYFLCGTISCRDFFGEHEVFNGYNNTNSLLYPHQTISIVGPRRCYIGLNFSMRLDLKDDRGHDLSCGYLSWCYVAASSWLDRRICSIVRGKDGFAAVHYTMFYNAAQARVAIVFVSNDDHQYQVYGRIHTRYTRYRYSTQYDRKFYQSVLLQKGEDEFLTLRNGDSVPLSKLVVAVPLDEALIVIANLKVLVGGREEKLRGKVEFRAQEVDNSIITPEPQSIGEFNFGLLVLVSWG